MKEQLARQPRPIQTQTASHIHMTSQQRSQDEEDEALNNDALYPQRLPSSTRRYWPVEEQGQHTQLTQQAMRAMQPAPQQTVIRYHYQQQRSAVPARTRRTSSQTYTQRVPPFKEGTQERPSPVAPPLKGMGRGKRRFAWHPLTYIGLTVLIAVVAFVVISSFLRWWNGYQDDLHYGRPRTFQCDVRVGHNDAHTPSHFIALNLHRHIEVIEFPGGDATKAHVYPGPTLIGDGQDLTPVTLTFKDVNGDGKLDMLVHIGTETTIVYLNDNGTFRPATATDHVTM